MKSYFLTTALLLSACLLSAQEVIHVGKGSYASYTPLDLCYSVDHQPGDWGWKGDKSRDMQTRKLYLTEREGQPIPTNDWWTNLMTEQYSGRLWSYPQMIQAQRSGIDIQRPSYWIADGTEMKSNTVLTVGGERFSPVSAVAEHWHDWDVEFSLKDGNRQMYVTMAHGMPFTWIETVGLRPTLQLQKSGWTDTGYTDTDSHCYDARGAELANSVTTDRLVMERGGDCYGIYLPQGTQVSIGKDLITLRFAQGDAAGYVVVALLPSKDALNDLAPYATGVPRNTRVSWKYDAGQGKMRTFWHVDAEDLDTGAKSHDVMMGFLPHQWRDTGCDVTLPFNGMTYRTPHGMLKMATGNDFQIDYRFYGMLPYWAEPDDTDRSPNPYDEDRMIRMLTEYANTGTFGSDTYWGGKGLTQMALYMMMAREMGKKDLFDQCRKRLKEVMVNWLTYTPGEKNRFFARYDRWGAMVGYSTSFDSDTFNDHHFHYGYFTLAGALLALVDDDFRDNYGLMLRLVAKDYANWDHEDTGFPFFRTFDPWAGHSFAGGMGDGNGNGQESSSEAMQSWGGLYLLGVALHDDEMRDAGIFGWLSEARGTAEYWFDRHRDNIDYTKFKHPYNSNLTCHGVGWWTYFGYYNLYMQGIQWMPTSTALDYLSEDKVFAKWDYEQLFTDPKYGGWFEQGEDGSLDKSGDWGNVTLSYLQRSDPDEAARLFDVLWDKNNDIAHTSSTNGISYFSTHSHLSHGDLDWSVSADIPTARVYRNAKGEKKHMAFNPTDNDMTVHFSDGFSLAAKARQLTVEGKTSRAVTDIVKEADAVDVRETILMPNLALHKPCAASSHENVGTLPEFATDGNDGSRWGSEHRDGEWIEVDLEQNVELYQVKIHWEAAFASLYSIQLSENGKDWTYSQDVTSAGGWDAVNLGDRTARYIRITGKKRATAYGMSLYEIQAFGKPATASAGDILGVQITADRDVLKQHQAARIQVKGYTNSGKWVDTEAQFSSDGGTFAEDGVFTPSKYGSVEVQARLTSGSDVYTRTFPVEEALYVRYITVSPHEMVVLADNTPQPVTISTTDQFGGPVVPAKDELHYIFSDPDACCFDAATQSVKVNKAGNYTLTVNTTPEIADTVSIRAQGFDELNLAYRKTATATSQNGDGSGPEKTVDGDKTGTRWESRWGNDQESLTIDLEATYSIRQVVVYWENARASEYQVQVSGNGKTWNTVTTVKDSPYANDTIDFEPVNARYVRIQGVKRLMEAYGYSIYEVEVFGNGVAEDEEFVSIDDTPDAYGFYAVTGYAKTADKINSVLGDKNKTAYDLTGLKTAESASYTLTPANGNAVMLVGGTWDNRKATATADWGDTPNTVVYHDGFHPVDGIRLTDNGLPVYTDFYISQVDAFSYRRTLETDCWTTLCLPYGMDVPAGLEVYELDTRTDGNTLTGRKVETIEAHMPYIAHAAEATVLPLEKRDGGNLDLRQRNEKAVVADNGIALHSCYRQKAGSAGRFYTLKRSAAYTDPQLTLQRVEADSFVYPFRSYFTLPESVTAESVLLQLTDEPSGIAVVGNRNAHKDDAVYTLDGRRGSTTLHGLSKGVYIQNGRKIVVK